MRRTWPWLASVLVLCLARPAGAQPEPETAETEPETAEPEKGQAPEETLPEPDGAAEAAEKTAGTADGEGSDKEETTAKASDDDDDNDASGGDDDDDDDDDDEEDEEEGDSLEIEWGARIQSDLRFRVEDKSVGNWYARRSLPEGIDRNENILNGHIDVAYGRFSGAADIDLVLYGYQQDIETIGDLSAREKLDPFRLDVHRLYIKVDDLILDGLDLTVGQQLILWGVGDQFNPTNNLNSDDLEDVLLFGEQQGNFMVRLDYWIDTDWELTGVVVPLFRPALLPRSGELSVANVNRLPMVDDKLRWRIHTENAAGAALAGFPTVVQEVVPELPEKSIDNVQLAYRIAGSLGGQDVALSYYNGRHDFPVPFKNHTIQSSSPRCNPDNEAECISGLLETTAHVHFPRMHVYGFNMTGEVGWLQAISKEIFNSVGYRIEAALIVPQRDTIELTNDAINVGGLEVPAGEYDYDLDNLPGGPRPAVVEDTPFAKWVVGLDYTFNKHVYLNIQWVHGLADEYGAGDWITEGYTVRDGGVTSDDNGTVVCAVTRDGTACAREVLRPRIGDYLVTGIDLRVLDQKLLLRLFTILDLVGVDETHFDAAKGERVTEHHSMFTEDGFGAVIYPEVNYNFGNGLDLGIGALWQIGKDWGKFGDPAAGGSLVWGRARFAF
jgi:hypothetical protein